MESKKIIDLELKHGAHNYHPLPVVLNKGAGVFVWDVEGKKYYDCLSAYSAVNQGQLNQTIVDAVVKHLTIEKLPTVPRSIRHKYMSAFLLAVTEFTQMDRVVPKVAGVESWELTFKLCRRWGYQNKGIPKNKAIIVGAKGNFHGRSMTAISMSDDPDSRKSFGPFMQGIELVPFNFPIFNSADIAINIAVLCLIIETMRKQNNYTQP